MLGESNMNKKVVLIGGGHGLSNLVKGFKDDNSLDLTIVVSSADDGGHTGKIRKEFKIGAVGDLRMVLSELIKGDSSLKEIFDYRFNLLHGVSKVSLGNLMITSLWLKYKDIDKVIDYFRIKEGIRAKVFLSSNNPVTLCAKCGNDEVIECEHFIGESNQKIVDLYSDVKAECNKEMLDEIKQADMIVLGPGSLYTSVGAVLCIEEIKKAINSSKASLVYVCNIMTQDGETRGYSVEEHENALSSIMGRKIDRVIVNNGKVSDDVLERYKKENSEFVSCREVKDYYEFGDLVEIVDGKVRHNSALTKKIILSQ